MNKTPVRPLLPNAIPVMVLEADDGEGGGDAEQRDADEAVDVVLNSFDEEDEVLCGPCEPQDDGEEVQPHRKLRHPEDPTQKDIDDHNVLHWPYRS